MRRSSAGQAERDRRRELLEGLRSPRTARVCVGSRLAILVRAARRDSRRSGFAEKRLSVFAQEQDGRDLAGVIGCSSSPRRRWRRTRRRLLPWLRCEDRGIDALAVFEMIEKL